MKRFRFTLQALLVVREREEQKMSELYAAALAVRQRAAEAVRSRKQEIKAFVRRGLAAERVQE